LLKLHIKTPLVPVHKRRHTAIPLSFITQYALTQLYGRNYCGMLQGARSQFVGKACFQPVTGNLWCRKIATLPFHREYIL